MKIKGKRQQRRWQRKRPGVKHKDSSTTTITTTRRMQKPLRRWPKTIKKKKNDANKYTLGMYVIMYRSKRFSDKDRKGVGRAKCNRMMGGRLLFWQTRCNISFHNLHTLLYTSPLVLTRRICLSIKASSVGDHFLYSHHFHVWLWDGIVRRN